jgi:CheY-like chemotaxis protein
MEKIKVDLAYIIDDDEVIIYLTGLINKDVEFCDKMLSFTDSGEALSKIKTALELNLELPSLILIDLNMPVMNGWTFLDELSKLKIGKDIPVFIFSSSINQEDINRSKKYKIVKDYIIKPLTVNKINKILRTI